MYNILYRMEFRNPEIVELIIAAGLKRIYNSLDSFYTTTVLWLELFACHNEKRMSSEKEK